MMYGIAFFILAGIVFFFIQRAEDDEPGAAKPAAHSTDPDRNGDPS